MGKRRKNGSSRAHRARRRATPTIGCLVVHGIGQKRRGNTLASIAEPIVEGMQWFGVTVENCRTPLSSDNINSMAVNVRKGRREATLVFAEGHWADQVRPPKSRGIKAATADCVRLIVWLVQCLPMLIATVGPDQRDLERQRIIAAREKRQPTAFRRAMVRYWNDPTDSPAMMWRILTLVLWAILAVYVVKQIDKILVVGMLDGAMAGAARAFLVGFFAVLFLAWSATRWNLAEHVRIAAIDTTRRRTLIAAIDHGLDQLTDVCDKVIVVAHSQGGYLSYRLLREGSARHEKVIGLYAIGSGLRPIVQIGYLARRRTSLCVAMSITAILCISGVLYPMLDSFVADLGNFLGQILLIIGTVSAVPVGGMQSAFALTSETFTFDQLTSGYVAAWNQATDLSLATYSLFALGMALLASAHFIAKLSAAQPPTDLPWPVEGRRFTWREYSSAHDIVGRLVYPTLPDGVEQRYVPSFGNPFADHTLGSYLNRRAPLRYLLSADLLIDLKLVRASCTSIRCLAHATSVARGRAARRYNARGLLVAALCAMCVLISSYRREASLFAIFDFWPILLFCTVFLHLLFFAESLLANRRWSPDDRNDRQVWLNRSHRTALGILMSTTALICISAGIAGAQMTRGESPLAQLFLGAGGVMICGLILGCLMPFVYSGCDARLWVLWLLGLFGTVYLFHSVADAVAVTGSAMDTAFAVCYVYIAFVWVLVLLSGGRFRNVVSRIGAILSRKTSRSRGSQLLRP